MAVLLPEVVRRLGLAPAAIRGAIGLNQRQWDARLKGEAHWGEEEIDRALDYLHDLGRTLSRLRRSEVVEPGTVLREAGKRYARINNGRQRPR